MPILSYIFYPNPGNAYYTSTSMLICLGVAAAMVLLSIIIRVWRRGITNPLTKKLSRSWASATLWFGIVAAIFVVSRVEHIQFLAMRFMWALWAAALLLYVFFQVRQYRAKHYEVLPRVEVVDPRDQYLPGKKRR